MTPTLCLSMALALAPGSDAAPRERVCAAILASAATHVERLQLLVVAAEESHFRADVLSCRKRGDQGRALGAWQVHGRNPRERKALCAVGVAAANIALSRMRESEARCAHLPAPMRQANYAGSSCRSKRGRVISARRWALVEQLATQEQET